MDVFWKVIDVHIHIKGKNDKKAKHFLLDDIIIINNDEGIHIHTNMVCRK